MAKILWDKYETALLIEAYIDVKNHGKGRAFVVKELSKQLRALAIYRGISIDDKYRNENGINLQLSLITGLFNEERIWQKSSSKIFDEMVNLYKKDENAFNEILSEAKSLLDESLGNKQNRGRQIDFVRWLNGGHKLKGAEVQDCVDSISFAFKFVGIDPWSLDETAYSKARNSIIGNRKIKHANKKLFSLFKKFGRYYLVFLKTHDFIEESDSLPDPENVPSFAEETDRGVVSEEEENAVMKFFENEGISLAFLKIFEYQKKTVPDILLDVRTSIIGAKRDEERLRFYSFANGQIRFGKASGNAPVIIFDLLNSNFNDACQAIDATNIFFQQHPSEVSLREIAQTENEKECRFNTKAEEMTISRNPEREDDGDFSIMVEDRFKSILYEGFPNGLKIDSGLAKRKFIALYAEKYGEELNLDDNFERQLRKCGFTYGNSIYSERIVDDDTREKLLTFISHTLQDSVEFIYYTSLFEQFSNILAKCLIYDAMCLKAYLRFIKQDIFYCDDDYISKTKGSEINIKKQLIDLFVNAGGPLENDDVYRGLYHIDKSKIDEILMWDNDFLINVRGRSRFYYKTFLIDDAQLQRIRDFLNSDIENSIFKNTTTTKLFEFIQHEMPDLVEANPGMASEGYKNILERFLDNEFDFNGSIISLEGADLHSGDLYGDFCEGRDTFELSDLDSLKDLTNGIINTKTWETIYKHVVRINETTFVNKRNVSFDVERVDAAIEFFIKNGYAGFESFVMFTDFPTCAYPWNEYLLESYVFSYSQKFILIHKTFNQGEPSGAVVSKTSKIKTIDDLIVKVLKDNRDNVKINNVDSILDFLLEHQYISKKRVGNIEELMDRAGLD